MIVTVAVATAIVFGALAFERVTVKLSLGSSVGSFAIGTSIVVEAAFAGIVFVPELWV